MIRLIFRFGLIVLVAAGFAWLADQPGEVRLAFQNKEFVVSPLFALIALVVVTGALITAFFLARAVLSSPRRIKAHFRARRESRGWEALSRGLIATSAGDARGAVRNAERARAALGNKPLVQLLVAQSAQIAGNAHEVKQAFEVMADEPETRLLGLRGLYTEARNVGDRERAQIYAERALRINETLPWASTALLHGYCSVRDWRGARISLEAQQRSGQLSRAEANRLKAVVLTAEAQALAQADLSAAGALAQKAHGLDSSLVPAAVLAARSLAVQGHPRRAMRLIKSTWHLEPHPDLAEAAASAKPEDTVADRYRRVAELVKSAPPCEEGHVALATFALALRDWTLVRRALEPFQNKPMPRRVCILFATLVEGETGDQLQAREWLARAMVAHPDPRWMVDGIILPQWSAVSPVTGELVCAQWRTPLEEAGPGASVYRLPDAPVAALVPPAADVVTVSAAALPALEAPLLLLASDVVLADSPAEPPAKKQGGSRARMVEAVRQPDDPGPL